MASMKGYVFASNPSDQIAIPFWSLAFGVLLTGAGLASFTNPSAWCVGLLFLCIGLNNLVFWVRSFRRFPDMFVDMAGIIVIDHGVELHFRWPELRDCSRVRWQPFATSTSMKRLPSRPSIYRLTFAHSNRVVYFNDTDEGRLLDHHETMAGLIERRFAETRADSV